LLDFTQYAVALNLLVFAGAAGVIWYAGTKLERQADAIALRTGLGKAFVGMLLLAGATSLPEIATTVTALLIGNVPMAVHNLLGSVVFNTAALAIADAVSGRSALTQRAPRYVLIIAGLGVVFLLAVVLMGTAVARGVESSLRPPAWLVLGRVWEMLLIAAFLGVLYVTYRGQVHPRWQPTSPEAAPGGDEAAADPTEDAFSAWSSAQLYGAFAAASLAVLAAAWLLTQTGDALAVQTGLGGGFVGFTLIALATTLPEISTTVAAARAGHDEMAVTNIFGSSAFVVMLLGVTGLVVGDEILRQAASPTASFAAALGMVVTLVYLWGLLERQDRTYLRMGWDSLAVTLLVLGGSWVVYVLE